MSEVTIRSESGKTEIKTTTEDSRFSTILSMYDVHGVPDIVIVPGSAGEILDEEYENLEKLDEYRLASDRIGVPSSIYLSQINRIRYVLDLTDEDTAYALVDKKISQKDRLHQYELLYGILTLDQRDIVIKYRHFVDTFVYTNNVIADILRLSPSESFIGAVYNTVGVSGFIDGTVMIWEDVLLITDIQDEVLLNTAMMLSGNAELDSEILLPRNSFWKDHEQTFLLNQILPSIPDDFSLIEVLSPSIWESSIDSPILLAKYLLRTAFRTTYAQSRNATIAYDDIENVKILESHIGRYALVRMLLSILYSIDADKGNKSLNELVTTFESYLEKK